MATAVLLPSITPPDYFRIISPTLQVPLDRNVSTPVGLLSCQRDPLLKELVTNVISCNVYQPPPAPAGKKTKKAVAAPSLPNDSPILEVVLQDTVIFPEGGGQPTDTGLITTSDGTTFTVLQAKRHGDRAVHYVRVSDVDMALSAFTPGSSVTASLGRDDFDRRYDHMSMHTSQHLLSAVLEARLNIPTLSWSLTTDGPCYVEIPRGMTVEEIKTIQAEANRLVFEGRRVYTEVQELEFDQEAVPAILESGRAVGRGLPTDYTGGVKRFVIIDGVDRNPCCGTHLPSLHNLQLFILPHTEVLSRSSTTSTRLYFLSGPRLIQYLSSTHDYLTSTSSILSCGAPLVPERVSQVVDERKKADKRVADLEVELSKHIGIGLVSEARASVAGSGRDDFVFKKHVHRIDDGGNPLLFLSAISSAFSEQNNSNVPYLLVLTSTTSLQTSSSNTVVMISGSNEQLVNAAGDALKSSLAVKGGGKGLKWSAKYTGVWTDKQGASIDAIIESLSQN